MSENESCVRRDLGEGYMVCEDALLPSGEGCTVYFGPCGVYAIVTGRNSKASALYHWMRELFGTVQVRLYFAEGGVYDPAADACGPEYDDDDLTADVNEWIGARRPIYKPSTLLSMLQRLEYEDAKVRGYKVGEDGEIYLYRHGHFQSASPCDPDRTYRLALFGGTLGLHRFAIGKWFSGIFYLLTGGIFLVGWLTDLLFLLIGGQKDRKKRYLFPLSERRKALFLLPLGLVTGVILFLLYLSAAKACMTAMNGGIMQQLGQTDPAVIQSILDNLEGFAESLGG